MTDRTNALAGLAVQKYNDLQIQLCYYIAKQAQREGMSDGMGDKGETRGKNAESDAHRL
jgi:hypothetical protein